MLWCRRRQAVVVKAAKQLNFNKDGEALKKMQAGVDKLASVVGITLGPKARNSPLPLSCKLTCQYLC